MSLVILDIDRGVESMGFSDSISMDFMFLTNFWRSETLWLQYNGK